MRPITPHLWFDRHAAAAAEFYAATFPASAVTEVTTIRDTPSGDVEVVSFELWSQPFMALNGGPLFEFTPAVSFLVSCDTVQQVDAAWDRLSDGGTPLMDLDSYPFSDRYGWIQDRYGLSWQLMHAGQHPVGQRITPTLMFVGEVHGRAEEAIGFYTSSFPDSTVGELVRYGDNEAPDVEGTIKHGRFSLAGLGFAAMDSAHDHRFGFNEAVSFVVGCDTQEEIDRYWDALSAVAEAEQCGWLKDRYGLSWQVVPASLDELLRTGTREQTDRVTAALLQMNKLDLPTLRAAYDGP